MKTTQQMWTMFIIGMLFWLGGIYLIWHYTNGWVALGVVGVIGGNNIFNKLNNNIPR